MHIPTVFVGLPWALSSALVEEMPLIWASFFGNKG